MKFELSFAPTAIKSWVSLPRWAQRKLDLAFNQLQLEPRRSSGEVDVHQLYGYRNVWTLRVPPFRGIYVIEGSEVVFVVFGHRETVYSHLHALLPPDRRAVYRSGNRRIR